MGAVKRSGANLTLRLADNTPLPPGLVRLTEPGAIQGKSSGRSRQARQCSDEHRCGLEERPPQFLDTQFETI